ncbi:hypothetical protein [Methylomonas rhizoryzae]|uniref:hypothetical protein n=1 Tax=Methylomonas rhizoryzae TaxID=2608981 RepID=UPI0012325AAB|nr:hypothetical protein [Methylomonas rhizoryzae]
MHRHREILATALTLALSSLMINGCATSPPKPKSESLYKDFLNGDVRLECRVTCGGAFGSSIADMNQLYNAGLWKELAEKVYLIGFNQDIAYFFLGRAAEGLEKYKAAETYYLLAQSATACVLGGCGGLVFPDIVNSRLANLKDKKINQNNVIETKTETPINNSNQIAVSPNALTNVASISCKTNDDCPPGEECRSISGGGAKCTNGTARTDESLTSQSVEKPLEDSGKNQSKEEIELVYSGGVYEIPATH